ncbi:ATP synthase F0F1 subunit gamma [Methylacidiphilum kamchatkense Kam1]|uniref:ATP synthase F0F1 subunit gamma n=1 Tax=Methylacidiphilum kamchatkense Kam1 TaxID=1202785 RepID=A0A0C1UNL1_9BACT|nr:FoF1 ATP synthase subunit gamma [Methylacidiphilum kamchatkense]KIE58149.1 ATP synthase F0F1 subunit gamma [Methylacidiphilum kamchatkense Kam1]QDQ42158.1 F-type H+-transporting ATPase subunit gamma [Methylacidiphilum kamchatkense Kam1]
MSKRRDLIKYRGALLEIGEIMKAMKNMALVEQRKIAKYFESQKQAVDALQNIADDFFPSFPDLLSRPLKIDRPLYILIGSERGFCGDFNSSLTSYWENMERSSMLPDQYGLILVGSKLESRASGLHKIIKAVSGPSVAEDVAPFIFDFLELVRKALIQEEPPTSVSVFFHLPDNYEITRKILLPIPVSEEKIQAARKKVPSTPLLYIDPREFFMDLVDNFLLVGLFFAFYSSLLAESKIRMEHMQSALDQLDRKVEELNKKANRLRQEEITEEIEVILLGSEALRKKIEKKNLL